MNSLKRFQYAFLLLLSAVVLSSCTSVMKKDEAKKIKKGAVISVVSATSEVDTSSTGSGLLTLASELSQRDKLSMLPTLNYTKNKVMENRRKMFPFTLAGEGEVLSIPAFKKIESQKDVFGNFTGVQGYPALASSGKAEKETVKFLASAKNLNATIIVEIFSSLTKSGVSVLGVSIGNIKAKTNMTITVYDAKGATIIKKKVEGESETGITQFMGWYKVAEVNKICAESIDDAVSSYIDWMDKELKK